MNKELLKEVVREVYNESVEFWKGALLLVFLIILTVIPLVIIFTAFAKGYYLLVGLIIVALLVVWHVTCTIVRYRERL